MKKVNNTDFLAHANKAIHCYSMSGRISSAAGLAKECAEKLQEDYDYEDAIKYFENAAQLYSTDNSDAYERSCLMKVADLQILSRNYSEMPKCIKVIDLTFFIFLTVDL